METTDSTQDLRRKVKNPGCKFAQVRVQRPISAGNFKWFGYYQLDYIVAKCKFAIGTCVLYLNESRLEFALQKTE